MPGRTFAFSIFIVLFVYVNPQESFSQISASNPDNVFTLYYDADSLHRDSVFVYHSPRNNGLPVNDEFPLNITLRAYHSDTTSADFTWKKLNENTKSFENIDDEDVLVTDSVSQYSLSLNGNERSLAFQVIIEDINDSTETHHAWVYLDHLYANIMGTNEADIFCEDIGFLEEDIQLEHTDFHYYDIYNAFEEKVVDNELTYLWRSDKRDLEGYSDLPLWSSPKPLEDNETETFTLEVTDRFGNFQSTSWEIGPRVPKADFSFEETKGPSPFDFTAENNSVYADSMKIFYSDTLSPRYGVDSSWYAIKDTTYTYFLPGTYQVYIKVKNEHGCRDSMGYQEPVEIEVEERSIEINNNNYAFNPDKAPLKITLKSIKGFHMVIFDRYGRLVKRFEEYNIQEGERIFEWDGKVRNSNRTVPSGAYYYVIKRANYYTSEGEVRDFFKGSRRENDQIGNNQQNNNNNGGESSDGESSGETLQAGIIYVFRN